jgi:hypothetical protein
MNKQLRRELLYLLPVFLATIYCFRILKLLDDPKVIEWPPKVQEVQAKGNGLSMYSIDNVQNLINIYFPKDSGALKVAECESGFNAKATNNNSSAKGVYQIIDGTFKLMKCEGDPLEPEDNIKCALKIYDHEGGRFNTHLGWAASYPCHQTK